MKTYTKFDWASDRVSVLGWSDIEDRMMAKIDREERKRAKRIKRVKQSRMYL